MPLGIMIMGKEKKCNLNVAISVISLLLLVQSWYIVGCHVKQDFNSIFGIGMTVSCLHDISLTDKQIFIKLAWIYHWDTPSRIRFW